MSVPPYNPRMGPDRLYPESLKRLTAVRGLVLTVEALALAIAKLALGAQFPVAPIGALLTGQALLTGLLAWRMRRTEGVEPAEAFHHLLADAVSIAVLVYYTGGYANPFISLLLLPLIQATVLLRTRDAWLMAGLVAVAYTLLMRAYRPLVLSVSADAAVNMHLTGMWLNFLLTAALVATFMGRLADTLRAREAALAREHEQRLRDERLFALGLQAASAAHELATPLASIRLTLDNLNQDYAGDDELAKPLALFNGQLARMEHVLGQLRDAARGRGARQGPLMPASQWLTRIVEHWGLMRPQAKVQLRLMTDLPQCSADPVIESVILTLLNNAWEASRGELALAAGCDNSRLWVAVSDSGAGSAAGKPSGWGVGLDLARANLERIGGRLELTDAPDGGTRAQIFLAVEGASHDGKPANSDR